jgi:hypothetical protein
LLYGAHFTVTVNEFDPGPLIRQVKAPQTFYVYDYLDASDDKTDDGLLRFNDTFAGGSVIRTRTVEYRGDPADLPADIQFADNSPDFRVTAQKLSPPAISRWVFLFDPTQVANDLHAAVQIMASSAPSPRVIKGPGSLIIQGNGVGPTTLYANYPSFDKALTDLVTDSANDVSPIVLSLNYNSSLLNPGLPPTTFRISVPGLPAPNITPPLKLGTLQNDVESALDALPGIGAGGVTVSLVRTTGRPAPRDFADRYTITPTKNFFTLGPTPDFVVDTSDPALVGIQIYRAVPPGLLTKDQQDLFQTEDQRRQFFDDVIGGVAGFYTTVSAGIAVNPNPSPGGPTDYNLNWQLGASLARPQVLAEFANSAKPGLNAFLATPKASLNANQISFLLAQVLGEARRSAARHAATAYLNQLLHVFPGVPADASRSDLIKLIAGAIAHEFGHGLGLNHTGDTRASTSTSEVQQLAIQGGTAMDGFMLTYAGASTSLLPRNASALDVAKALGRVPGLGILNPGVAGPPGAPYKITFLTSGVDVPQITGSGTETLIVMATTLTEGSVTYVPSRSVKVGTVSGFDDLMNAAFAGLNSGREFLPDISQPLLRMSLGLNWDAADGKAGVSVVTQSATLGLDKLSTPGSPGSGPQPDPDDTLYDGPGLILLDAGGLSASRQIDFGATEVDGPGGQNVVQPFQLLNFGSQDETIRSVRVLNSDGSFSTPPVTATVLHPGESLDIPVTFDPLVSGPLTGTLVVDSSSEMLFGNRFDLTGTGQRTTAHLVNEFFGNNLGGVVVGQGLDRIEAGATLTNDGVQPVTITDVHMEPGAEASEFIVTGLNLPITLQPGDSFTVPMDFRPGAAGLRHAMLDIVSDDPTNPLIRTAVVGTGLINGNLHLDNDYVAVESQFREFDNTPVLRTRSDAMGNWSFFLAPNLPIHVVIFDPISGLVSNTYGVTNSSGQPTQLVISQFAASGSPDSDGDGLPDDIAFAIGTDPHKVDTNGDGISDYDAIQSGLDPLAGRPVITGVMAGLSLEAEATDIKVVSGTANPSRQLAYVAEANGLAIADVSRFDHPVLLSELRLQGLNTSVAVDAEHPLVAVAAGQDGVHLIDVTDPTQPTLRTTISINAGGPSGIESGRVDFFQGLLYLASGSDIVTFDPETLEEVQRLSLGDAVVAMRRDGTGLFALTADSTLHAIDLSGLGMVARGSLVLPRPADDLVAADGVAWISSVRRSGFAQAGLMTADISSLD